MSEEITAPTSPNDLRVGMELRGKVKNIELYGAFVDIGVGQDALLHISQLGTPNVRNVEDVVKTGEEITVYVLKVDKGKVALSLVKPPSQPMDALQEGVVVSGKVVRVEKFGAFVDIGAEKPGMVHVSELSDGYVKSPSDVVKVGDEVQVRVLKIDRKGRKIDLSMKTPPEPIEIEEEETEETPTAMAMALRRAMKEQSEDEEEYFKMASSRRSRKDHKKGKRRSEQDEILERTLRHQTR